MKIPITLWIHKANVALQALGVWGLGGMAIVDSSSIPMPLDALLIKDVAENHSRFLLYCFIAALGSAVGSLLPYYLGRAGGELFLLKRINRKRYEQLRDRFEKQEFLAIMIPAMMPPPMPVKLFELAAGVFEMKPLWFFCAILVREACAVSDLGGHHHQVWSGDHSDVDQNPAPSPGLCAGRGRSYHRRAGRVCCPQTV